MHATSKASGGMGRATWFSPPTPQRTPSPLSLAHNKGVETSRLTSTPHFRTRSLQEPECEVDSRGGDGASLSLVGGESASETEYGPPRLFLRYMHREIQVPQQPLPVVGVTRSGGDGGDGSWPALSGKAECDSISFCSSAECATFATTGNRQPATGNRQPAGVIHIDCIVM